MHSISKFLYRKPRTYVRGHVGTGWLGLLVSWVFLGGGVTLAVVSAAGFFSVDQGVCEAYHPQVCRVANLGGVITGVAALAGSVLWSITIARGFGPPAAWWAVPGAVGGLGAMLFLEAVAGETAVPLAPVLISVALMLIATALIVMMMPQREQALAGWTRLDGLDAGEVRMRGIDGIILPGAAVVAAGAGGAFALHVFRLLTNG